MRDHLKYLLALAITAITGPIFGQKPREISLENDPVDWTDPAKIVVLIAIPLFLLTVGLWLRVRHKNKKKVN